MIINRSNSRRAGFTLVEVLVTLAIVAILAAVLLPSLTSQLSKGDTGRVAGDLTSIQSAAQAYVSDVRRYPLNLSDLTNAITVSSTDINGASIPANLVSKWKGPYLGRDVGATAGGVISTVFTPMPGGNGVNYLGVTVTAVTAAEFANVEALFDDGVGTSSTSSTTGLVRYNSGSSTLTFMALAIQ